MKYSVIFTLLLAITLNAQTKQYDKMSILDYFLDLPDSAFNLLDSDDYNKENRIKLITEPEATQYRSRYYVIDKTNHYMRLNKYEGIHENVIQFKRFSDKLENGLFALSISAWDEEKECYRYEIQFFNETVNGMKEVIKDLIPQITFNDFWSEVIDLPGGEFRKVFIYCELPRYGDAISLYPRKSCNAVWSDDEDKAAEYEEVIASFKYRTVKLGWDYSNERFEVKLKVPR